MNKIYNIVLLIIISCSYLIYSQSDFNNSITGKNWREFTDLAKGNYLMGIDNGLSWAISLVSPKINNQKCLKEIEMIIINNILDEINYTDLVREVDEFYKSGPNINIPVLFAYDYTKRKYFGEAESELEKLLNGYRNTFNR